VSDVEPGVGALGRGSSDSETLKSRGGSSPRVSGRHYSAPGVLAFQICPGHAGGPPFGDASCCHTSQRHHAALRSCPQFSEPKRSWFRLSRRALPPASYAITSSRKRNSRFAVAAVRSNECYGLSMTAYWLIMLLFAAACGGPRFAGGPVKPSPPGPMDVIRGVWGDYGGRCPGDYRYCKGHGEAVCCPITSRCEEDAGGSYCEPRTAMGGGRDTNSEPRATRCDPDEIACSYRGQTTCCASDERCCTIDGAASCCR
jgi:hypothetical protein